MSDSMVDHLTGKWKLNLKVVGSGQENWGEGSTKRTRLHYHIYRIHILRIRSNAWKNENSN